MIEQGVKIIQTFVTKKNIPSMAAWLNKWLLAFLFPFTFYTTGDISSAKAGISPSTQPGGGLCEAEPVHPFHVSVVEINHNGADKTLEISCKIFTDDFEKVLAQNYKTKVDLINTPATDRKRVDTLVKKYISEHLSLTANGRPVSFNYLGFEHENDAVFSYLQVDGVASVKKIGVANKIMYDFFNDQINLMHVTVGGNRKSSKLDYPASFAEFVF
jgi:hypothetical protein